MATSKPDLRIDWATLEATRFACEHWHYSKCIPMPPMVRIGVWEQGRFVGVVIFSRGASPHLLGRYGLGQDEGCELTRFALTKHATPVSRIGAIAMRWLCKHSPGLRLIASFADPSEGHHGGIYQAMGFIYAGTTSSKVDWMGPDGRQYLNRQVSANGVLIQFGKRTRVFRKDECTRREMPPKHRYLLPLDAGMRAVIAPLAQSYPKRASSEPAMRTKAAGGRVPPDPGRCNADPCAPSEVMT